MPSNGDPNLRVPELRTPRAPAPPVAETPDRQAVLAAADAYDRAWREREELRHKLDEATLGLEAKNQHIMRLEADLAEERNRVESYRAERDQAIADRAEIEAFVAEVRGTLDHVKSRLEAFELPRPVRRSRPRRNGLTVPGSAGISGESGGNVSIPNRGGAGSEVSEPNGSEEPLGK